MKIKILTYVESKHAKLTNKRLKLFRISFWTIMILTIVLPNMPKMATIVVKTPSTQNEKKSNRSKKGLNLITMGEGHGKI